MNDKPEVTASPEQGIPRGNYCYTWVMNPEDSGRRSILPCPHWQWTEHGTVRCLLKGYEEIDDSETEASLALLDAWHAGDEVARRLPLPGWFADMNKICDINTELEPEIEDDILTWHERRPAGSK
jgi:hypothetical protein